MGILMAFRTSQAATARGPSPVSVVSAAKRCAATVFGPVSCRGGSPGESCAAGVSKSSTLAGVPLHVDNVSFRWCATMLAMPGAASDSMA